MSLLSLELFFDELLLPERSKALRGNGRDEGVFARDGGGGDGRPSGLLGGAGRELGKGASLCGFCGFVVGTFLDGPTGIKGFSDERLERPEFEPGFVS